MTATEVEPAPNPDEQDLLPHERAWQHPWMSPFLRSLFVLPDVSSACRVARIGRTRCYEARNTIPAFEEAWDEALALAADLIQRQAHTWITTGVPVRSSRTVTKRKTAANGTVIETVTEEVVSESAERSATLMIFWLKAHYPERYRWSERVEATGIEGGPIQVESLSTIDAKIAELSAELAARGQGDPVPVED